MGVVMFSPHTHLHPHHFCKTLQWAGVDTEVNNKQLKRVTGSTECGKLVCSWAFVLGQRANGVLAS